MKAIRRSSRSTYRFCVSIPHMISTEEFNLILKEKGIEIPEDLRDSFQEFIELQADILLDSWLETKKPVV